VALLRVDLGLLGNDPISSDVSIPRLCETGSGGPAGLNSTDSSRTGPAPADSGTVDCGPVDSDQVDTDLGDTAQVSSGAAGSGPADIDPVDTDSAGRLTLTRSKRQCRRLQPQHPRGNRQLHQSVRPYHCKSGSSHRVLHSEYYMSSFAYRVLAERRRQQMG
jgi:hypothetical protein